MYNAQYMGKNGAAVVIPEKELSGEILAEQIKTMLSSREHLSEMSKAARELAITNACDTIYDLSLEITGKRIHKLSK